MDVSSKKIRHPGSFRDPSGYIVMNRDITQRVINPSYFPTFELLAKRDGLYDILSKRGLLVTHRLIEKTDRYICIEPTQIPLITFPFEWSFHQLKDAALLTLQVAKIALQHDMHLKDASAFNIQFKNGIPIFIDTLSFEQYIPGRPWCAYGQFVRHFLGPLCLMSQIDVSLGKLSATYIDGIPLDIVSKLLPRKTWFYPSIYLNIHAHAKQLKRHQNDDALPQDKSMSKAQLMHLLDYLEIIVNNLSYAKAMTEWSNYYDRINYSSTAFQQKQAIIESWVKSVNAKHIWDVGSNNGHFARALNNEKIQFICSDIDPVAVDNNYVINKKKGIQNILPLIIDVTNPTSALGFNHKEREDFTTRLKAFKVDCILALALVHHLCLTSNCSFDMILEYFASISSTLILEFIPPEDSWAKVLLEQKREFKHLFDFYNQANFEKASANYFHIQAKHKIPESDRTLYFLKRK